MAVTALQFVVAFYLMYIIVKDISYSGDANTCFLGQDTGQGGWKKIVMISFLVLLCLVVVIQCFTGSDVLRWRSFYATHDNAWKAHYREVFDHSIREALCCMGRVKYLSVLEEDEIYSVARLLGDLVAYRASGTGHLELLAGLALLQRHKQSPKLYTELVEAPESRLREAVLFHQFSEAAYTGPLLDFGRNPVLFPCAWLYRQGVLTPWSRGRRPVLEGDNWWRGHAAAFLKCVNISPEDLRRGRVKQTKREAAYFVVVLHDMKSLVIAVRGTETPEDLITDGLCRECDLSEGDLDGLINSNQLPLGVRETVLSTFPHYGHSGIVESARELFRQIDGNPDDKDDSSEKSGFLSSLLGNGCECHGYKVRIVGHSLGGAVAIMLGLRLYARYPDLHVFAYGPLPCVDSVIAEACSDFVTSIVYNDEFSSRLSVNSILRLRGAAIGALSDDSSPDSAIISKLARRILHVRKYQDNEDSQRSLTPSSNSSPEIGEDNKRIIKRRPLKYTIKGGAFICGHAVSCMMNTPSNHAVSRETVGNVLAPGEVSEKGACCVQPNLVLYQGKSSPSDGLEGIENYNNSDLEDGIYGYIENNNPKLFESSDDLFSFSAQSSPIMDAQSPVKVTVGEFGEVFLPGLIVHIIPEERSTSPLWKSWMVDGRYGVYKAYIANRESFKDIIVSPYMFLDHLPWRCHYALQRVLDIRKCQGQETPDMLNGDHLV